MDLGTITDRMSVRKAIQCGNVQDAIEKVNDLNPEVGIQLILSIKISGFALKCQNFASSFADSRYKSTTVFPSPTTEAYRTHTMWKDRRSFRICSRRISTKR
jgi:hypothetical protein